MSNKEKLIQAIEELIQKYPDSFNEEVLEYWKNFKEETSSLKTDLTEKGALILNYMHTNKELHNNLFTAQSIGTGLHLSGKSVSGSMRKLVSNGYVEKLESKPITYQITLLGIDKIKNI